MEQEARQRTGRIAVRTGAVVSKVAGGAATIRGLANKTNDDVIPAMTSSKPVFQVTTTQKYFSACCFGGGGFYTKIDRVENKPNG